MAAGTQSGSIYYGIFNGKVCRQFGSKTETSVERVNKLGKIVHEEFYDYLDGFLTNIEIREHEDYGKQLVLVLKDEGTHLDQYFQFQMSSGFGNAFLKTLPNIDLSKKITLIPSQKIKDDKKESTLFIKQGGATLKRYYTKDHPNGIPEMTKVKFKGEEKWDDYDVMVFLEEMIKTDIRPKLAALQASGGYVYEPSQPKEQRPIDRPAGAPVDDINNQDAIDDLPF